jgi:SpoVK/Ycf46/Vps4 family AAA+-type ATPase
MIVHACSEPGRQSLKRFKISDKGVVVLFSGPSGTGKTLAAQTVATRLGVTIYRVDCARIRDKYYGESERRARALFAEFREISRSTEKPPLLLFDEADQILGTRMEATERSVDQTANAVQNIFLEELERFPGLAIATTNLPGALDPAFARRFLFKVEFPKPDAVQRLAILRMHLKGVPHSRRIDLERIARDVPATGGEIRHAVHAAVLAAALEGTKTLEAHHLEKAFGHLKCLPWPQNQRCIGFG